MNKPNTIGYILTESACKSEANIIDERNDRLFGEGPLQDLDVVNRNVRIYTKEDMDPDLNSERIQKELIPTGNFLGEANHPLDKSLARQQVVDLERAAVVYHKLWREGNIIKGQFSGTYNQFGEYFNKNLMAGYIPSFSLRALGSIDQKGGKSYVRNVRIISYDWVTLPSHKIAYMEKLIDKPDIVKTESWEPEGLYDNVTVCDEQTIPIMSNQVLDFVKEESANIRSLLENFDLSYKTAQVINEGSSVALTDSLGTTFVVNVEEYVKRQYMDSLFR